MTDHQDATPTPDAAENRVRLAHNEFYATIGAMNVHPSPVGRYHSVTGYVTEWKDPSGRIMGISDGGTTFLESRYYGARK